MSTIIILYIIRSIQVYCNCDLLIACLNIVTNPCILVNESHVQEKPQLSMQQLQEKFKSFQSGKNPTLCNNPEKDYGTQFQHKFSSYLRNETENIGVKKYNIVGRAD